MNTLFFSAILPRIVRSSHRRIVRYYTWRVWDTACVLMYDNSRNSNNNNVVVVVVVVAVQRHCIRIPGDHNRGAVRRVSSRYTAY